MKTATKALLLLFLLGLVSLSPHAQTPSPTPDDDDEKVTKQERLEIRRFSQRFVSELEKTQDIRPLTKRYFAEDFEDIVFPIVTSDSPFGVGEVAGRLKKSEITRFATAGTNLLYFSGKSLVEGEDSFQSYKKMLPPELAKEMEHMWDEMDSDKEHRTRRDALRVLYRMETLAQHLTSYFQRHPFESFASYRQGVKENLSDKDYDYRLLVATPTDDENDELAGKLKHWAQSHDPAARFFGVTTPVGIALFIVKTRGRYKVIFIMPYPVTSS